ncbi:MAG: glycosyltransferase [Lachnospiraceae bacterium]|nr:glycosyltransferase [Lachnospiraceae bacterium]
MSNERTVDVVIPVYRPGEDFREALRMLQAQEVLPGKIILMETVSEEAGPALPEGPVPVEVHRLRPEDFDHGGTRRQGVSFSNASHVLLMTQDAVPADTALTRRLLAAFEDPSVAAAYARQLPKEGCILSERCTRAFNYPPESRVKSAADLPELGLKTFFCSNVCAMYDRAVMERTGGFPGKAIFNEDMVYAYGLIRSGYKIAYAADAAVYHSHNLTGKEQFRRNFDLGVSQAQHPEIFDAYPSEKEGGRLVRTIVKDLLKSGKVLDIPVFLYRCAMRYAGYRYGKRYKKLSEKRILKYTMNRNYWRTYQNGTD